MAMKITVKYFSILSEITKKNEEQITLEKSLTVAELFSKLSDQYNFEQHREYLRFAVNCEYVKNDFIINANDEVALITPVAGG